MQEAKTRTPAEEVPSSRPPWIRAVAIAAAVALLGGVLYATWQAAAGNDDPEPDPIGLDESEPDFSLSDENAVSRFEELVSMSYTAIRNRDQSLLSEVFTVDSPTKDRSAKVISSLKQDQVTDESSYRTLSLRVLESGPQEIRLLQRVQTRPCFKDESGEDVTTGRAEIEYDIEWTMQISDSRWLLHESQARNDEVTDESPASC
jgi:hypothetical protein